MSYQIYTYEGEIIMFDINENIDNIIKMIDNRASNCYIVPLYVNINRHKYALWELEDINEFSNQSFKVGFGTSIGVFVKKPFPTEKLFDFDIISTPKRFNDDYATDVQYYIFEADQLTLTNHDELDIQIAYYTTKLAQMISASVKAKREEMRKQLVQSIMNDDE